MITRRIQNHLPGILLLLTSLFLLSACGSKGHHRHHDDARQTVIQTAKKLLGTPYVYGGNSPQRGFDCSGLVQYSHKAAGIQLPRTTRQLYRATKPVRRRSLQAGDLVFFRINPGRTVSHVGIYLGNGKFIHAPSSGKRVKISSLKDRYWTRHYLGAGRVL